MYCLLPYFSFTRINGTVDVERNTVNRERFAGLNFRVLHSFQEYREIFSVKTLMALKPNIFSPTNLSPSMV